MELPALDPLITYIWQSFDITVVSILEVLPYHIMMSVRGFSYNKRVKIPTIANVFNNFKPGEVYNICGTEYRSVKDLSELVLKYTKGDPKLVNYLPEELNNFFPVVKLNPSAGGEE